MKLFIAFGVCAAWTSIAKAQEVVEEPAETEAPVEAEAPASSSAKKAAKVQWVRAQIYSDGAAVYAKPDFDSNVLDYLRYQTPVFVSRKPYAGVGGMGLFHMVRYGKKSEKAGYVPDTDVRMVKKEIEKIEKGDIVAKGAKKKRVSKAWEKEEEEALGKAPLYFTRYIGGAVAYVNFTEKFSGKALRDNMLMYGLRMTGPGTLIEDGPPLDFNFWFSIDKPDYYKRFTPDKPSGFLMFGDIMAMLPLIDTKNTIINYGLGVMWVFTKYKVRVNNRDFDSSEFRIGFDAALGVGQKFGKYMVRADAKYYYEKTQYFGYILSFQGEY